MTGNEPIRPPAYAALLGSRNKAADIALVTAIEVMESAYRPMALSVLLARHYEPALIRLVAHWHTYDAHLQQLLASNTDGLASGFRVCVADERFEVRKSALDLIRASGNCKLAYLLGEALTQPCRKTVALAAQTLLSLVEHAQDHTGQHSVTKSSHPKTEMDHLAIAIRRGLASWPLHFRGEIVTAAARMSRYLEETILKMADDPRSKVARALNNLVTRALDPKLAGYCLRALRSPQLAPSVVGLLATTHNEEFRQLLVDDVYLLADEEVRKSCMRIRAVSCLHDFTDIVSVKGPGAIGRAVRLLAACGIRQQVKVTQLLQLAFSGNEEAARAAVWELVNNPFEGSEEALKSIAARSNMPMAWVAQLELRRRRKESYVAPRDKGYTEKGEYVAPEKIREIEPNFIPYWEDFDSLPAAERVAVGYLVKQNTDDFEIQLREKWNGGAAVDRIKVLKIIRDLHLAAAFENEIYEAAKDSDSVIRSMAIPLLGILDTSAGRRIIQAALSEPDTRVQANAVEAMEASLSPDKIERISPKLKSDDNRVRANAVKAMLKLGVREAAEELLDMLKSEDCQDRISALWVVERMQLGGVLERLKVVAQSDQDQRVRNRAKRIIEEVGRQGKNKKDNPASAKNQEAIS